MDQPLIKTLLARQGIYDKNGSIFAYELLYRNGEDHKSNVDNLNYTSGDIATSSVITQLFTNLDMNSIIGNKPAFINFTHNHLIHQIPKLLPKNRIYIEVLETVKIDSLLINNLRALSEKGYKIALDDFIFRDELAPLVDLAHIIKVDVLNLNKDQIAQQLTSLRQFKGKLLAEKIEDKMQFNNCIELGFDYFQGFFLNRPDPLKGQVFNENKSSLLHLLAELNDENISLERVERIILLTPTLSYRILRLANSASLYVGKKINSLMDAIKQLGLSQIRNWMSLLMLASMEDVIPDLLERTLIRAKMCELLAKASNISNPHQAYTVGILSTLDGILNEPMSSLLAKIQLSKTLNDALIYHKGDLGAILKTTIDYETANFNELINIPVNQELLTSSYLQAIEYASNIMNLITSK